MESHDQILNPEAKGFLEALHRRFNARRLALLESRQKVQADLDRGWKPEFPEATRLIREDLSWRGGETPPDLVKRYVEITGPVEKKMMINALNSGADVFMADFEDALSPTWKNVVEGQANLIEAVNRTLAFTSPEGKEYRLKETLATLVVRPRGWHLEEKHFLVDGEAISASLFDFGLYLFHNAKALVSRGTGPYFYLPKLENRFEAALWRDVFKFSEETLDLSQKTIKATVLIETILAAFEMEEILFELKSYLVGLNAGRWDYIFSIIKKFAKDRFCFPDRKEITMTVPFMKAYTSLLVHVCHKRGIHAMGGMSAFVPSRKDPAINAAALEQVTQDKLREVQEGFDGTWVAHPDLVPVARKVFHESLRGHPDQKHVQKSPKVLESDLLNFEIPGGKITLNGVINNMEVALLYLDSWLKGTGAVTIHNLMEDAATAEIARSQLWQWVHHHGQLPKQPLSLEFVMELMKEKKEQMNLEIPYVILKKMIQHKSFLPFLTLEAYPYLQNE